MSAYQRVAPDGDAYALRGLSGSACPSNGDAVIDDDVRFNAHAFVENYAKTEMRELHASADAAFNGYVCVANQQAKFAHQPGDQWDAMAAGEAADSVEVKRVQGADSSAVRNAMNNTMAKGNVP